MRLKVVKIVDCEAKPRKITASFTIGKQKSTITTINGLKAPVILNKQND